MPYNRDEVWSQRVGKRQPQACAHCNNEFTPSRDWQKYCSRACQIASNRITTAEFNAQQQALAKALEEIDRLQQENKRLQTLLQAPSAKAEV